ncbi:lysozyme inhibitor LprI family protein [Caldovatus aquaticus]|uniref:Lysozyme inhibitor LprI family protein n=1 Tax=Caldovatus aquaticus TaxID=2865671 RepID=A0ABS7F428_9PROT|nr:lysozyme inhibitor LprI family protein [Caldovatus aquaticus]MBW8269545.1 lysozyme inhibitor LprI family protein [Caldovatus aquaticus]
MAKLLGVLLAGGALAVAGAAAPARAASFDCARARSPAERLVCADPALSSLDERLAAAYRAALAAVPWQRRLRGDQAAWLRATRDRAAGDPATLAAAYRARIAALEAETRRAADPALTALSESQIAGSCVPLPPAAEEEAAPPPCAVRESGPLGTLDGRRLHYAIYGYPDPDSPDRETLAKVATVVFAETAPGRFAARYADGPDDVRCGAPRLLRAQRGPLLHIPCSRDGTGMFNAESVLAPGEGGRWRLLDTGSWTRDLGRRLPRGYGAWKGIYPDYEALAAVTPLWRDGDANCCPTGGRAEIRLGWEGDRLVLRDLRLRLGAQEVPR